MFRRFLAPLLLLPLCLSSLTLDSGTRASAQSAPAAYSDHDAFAADAADLKVFDFEGIAPDDGFRQFKREGSLTAAGAEFRPAGGGRFGAGFVVVVGAWYQAGPIYETTSGAKLIWAPPNQPGDAHLDVTPPAGATAVGADLWTAQPAASAVEVAVTTADGGSRAVTVNTPERPAAAFVGFTADSAITSLRFTLPKGQTGLVLDNFTFGRKAKGRAESNQAQSPRVSQSSPAPVASRTPTTAQTAPRPAAPSQTEGAGTQAAQPTRPVPASAGGTIAYVRGGTEIRLVGAGGSNDRQLWTHPDLTEALGIHGVAWRPDGKELAFSSSHDAVHSLYHADIYAIRPDGTNLRKLTNPPDRSEFARYPKGAVSVTVSNDQPAYQQTHASAGVFIIYVAGADEPQQVTLPPGMSKTLLFKSVADFSNKAQAVVAMSGKYRWFTPGLDVQAGRTVKAPAFSITGDGIDLFGAFRPVWRADGSRLSYRTGLCTLDTVPANPTPGEFAYAPLLGGKNPLGSCAWDWGPTPATANQVIYTENASGDSSVFRITEGGAHPGEKLTTYSDIEYQLLSDLRWLPDASGFLFSNVTLMRDSANIYRYDFSTRRVTQVTHLEGEFARAFSVSPDGRAVVFERAKTYDDDAPTDLWIVGTDGGGMRLLVKNGQSPSWGK